MEIKEENIINIHHYLPHREPMLMADYILELTKEKVVTSFEILESNIFAHNNHLAEAGLIENAAQTCSSILGQNFFKSDTEIKVIGFITSIKKIEVFGLPKVGDTIISRASLISQFFRLPADAVGSSILVIFISNIQNFGHVCRFQVAFILRKVLFFHGSN